MPQRLSQELIDSIRALRKTGLYYRQIAAELGCTYNTVYTYCHAGPTPIIPRPPRSRKPKECGHIKKSTCESMITDSIRRQQRIKRMVSAIGVGDYVTIQHTGGLGRRANYRPLCEGTVISKDDIKFTVQKDHNKESFLYTSIAKIEKSEVRR